MSLYYKIKHLYPDILDSEFSLRDDGDGVYIEKWTYGGAAKPDIATVEAVSNADSDAVKRQNAIDTAKAKMNNDPVFATIAQAVAVLKAAADGTTVNQAKKALLDNLETRI